MDLNHLKKACGVGLLTAAALSNPAAYAADASVTVDVNLPTVLVMYHYDTITLDLSQSAVADYLVTGTATVCGTGFCDNQGNPANVNVSDLSNPISVPVTDSGPGGTVVTLTLADAVGVRAFGCANYSASYTDGGSTGGATVNAGNVAGIDGQSCSFGMTTGDLDFDLDFAAVSGTSAQAVFDVTITGS